MNSTFFLLPLLAVVTNEDLWFLLAAVLLQLGLFAACLRLRHPAIAGIVAIFFGLVAIAAHFLANDGEVGPSPILLASAVVLLPFSIVAEAKKNGREFNKGNPILDDSMPPTKRLIWLAILLFVVLARALFKLLHG